MTEEQKSSRFSFFEVMRRPANPALGPRMTQEEGEPSAFYGYYFSHAPEKPCEVYDTRHPELRGYGEDWDSARDDLRRQKELADCLDGDEADLFRASAIGVIS
jgi:hypothetical protein